MAKCRTGYPAVEADAPGATREFLPDDRPMAVR